jgi:hypothetical protein
MLFSTDYGEDRRADPELRGEAGERRQRLGGVW